MTAKIQIAAQTVPHTHWSQTETTSGSTIELKHVQGVKMYYVDLTAEPHWQLLVSAAVPQKSTDTIIWGQSTRLLKGLQSRRRV